MAGLREGMMALLRYTPDSIFFKRYLDGRFIIEIVSEAKAKKYGDSWKDIIGKSDFDLLLKGEEAQECHNDELHVMQTGEPLINQVKKLTRLDGTTTWVSETKFTWIDDESGEIIGVIGIARDITDSREMEQHILKMLATATHKMRSPTHLVATELTLLSRGKYGEISEAAKEKALDIRDRALGLEGTISYYLAAANFMNSDKIGRKEMLDLSRDIIEPVLASFSRELKGKNIWIDDRLGGVPENAIMIPANKLQLSSVYDNLIGNAIKHLSDDGNGVIAVGFEDKEMFYRLNVYNNGENIPPGKRESIFEMGESGCGSSGLGLYMSRDFMRRQGGDLWCEEASGHPNFIIILPKEEDLKE
jgi:PAS domain S-box-containing protein